MFIWKYDTSSDDLRKMFPRNDDLFKVICN